MTSLTQNRKTCKYREAEFADNGTVAFPMWTYDGAYDCS